MHFLQQGPFLGKLQACHFAPVMVYLLCRTSGLDGSTAARPLLSATRGDPASSSVRRWVEMLAGRKIRMRDCCLPSTVVPLGNLERDGSPPVKGRCACQFRICFVSS